MYVIVYTRSSVAALGCTSRLVEMNAAEFKAAQASEGPGRWFRRLDSVGARRWVKNGGLHETALWVDSDGRVRYARDPEADAAARRVRKADARRKAEAARIRKVLRAVLRLGADVTLRVHDGEDYHPAARSAAEACEAITAVDQASVVVFDGLTRIGTLLFVLGNAPEEVLADWSTGDARLERLLESLID